MEEKKEFFSENNVLPEENKNNESINAEKSEALLESIAEESEGESSEKLEYDTMPGSWASYEAESGRQNVGGNGVYPDDGRINGGSYFGGYRGDGDRPYGQYPWQGYNGGYSPKPRKTPVLTYVICGIIAVFLIASAAISGYQLYNRFLDGMSSEQSGSGDASGSGSGQQGGGSQGGGSQNGGSQSGSSQSGGASSSSTGNGGGNIQNGDFTLKQESAGEQYKLSAVYQMVESTVVAITTSTGSGSGVIISEDEKNGDGHLVLRCPLVRRSCACAFTP